MAEALNPLSMWSTSVGTGLPIVMIHGAFCDFRYWESQQVSYGRHYQAISISLRGYYPDDKLAVGETFSADRHVDDVGIEPIERAGR